MTATDGPRSSVLYHGTRTDLKPGDLIQPDGAADVDAPLARR